MANDLARLFRHSGVYAVGSALNALGAFVLLPLYTHYLSAGEYGALELLYSASAVIMGVLSVGIGHATLRFYFEYDAEDDRRRVVSTNLWVASLIALIGVGIVLTWHQALVVYLFGDVQFARALRVVLIAVGFELSAQVGLAYIRAREYSLLFVGTALLRLVLQVVANSYFVIVQGMGIDGIVIGNALAVLTAWVIVSVTAVRECGVGFDRAKVPEILHYSAPFLLSTVCGLISTQVDKFLINSYLSLQLLGIYALATKFSAALNAFVAEPFNRAYGAFRFSVMKQANAAQIQAATVRYLAFLALTLSLVLGFFAADVLRVMSNAAFWPAAQLVPILMIAAVLNLIVYPLQTGILYQKKSRLIFYVSFIAAVVSAGANFVLIPRLGVYGAALAQVLTALAAVVATGWWSQRFFRVDYAVGKLIAVFAFAALLLALGQSTAALSWTVAIAVKLALLVVFVGVVLFSGFIDVHERARLFARVRAVAGR